MGVRLLIVGGILAGCIFVSACASYRREVKAEAEAKQEYLQKLEESGQVEPGTIKIATPKERVVEQSGPTPTPTPTPDGLLNRPLDPVGLPKR